MPIRLLSVLALSMVLGLPSSKGVTKTQGRPRFEHKVGHIQGAESYSLGQSSQVIKRLLEEMSRRSSEGKKKAQTFRKLLDSAGVQDHFALGQNGGNELLVAGRMGHHTRNQAQQGKGKNPRKKVMAAAAELYLNIESNKVQLSALGALPNIGAQRMTLLFDLDKDGAVKTFSSLDSPEEPQLSSLASELLLADAANDTPRDVRTVMRQILAGGPITKAAVVKLDGKKWVVNQKGEIRHPAGFLVVRDSRKLFGWPYGQWPFFVAHDFGPKVLISKQSGFIVTAGNDDYLVRDGTLFAKRNGKLYPHRETGESLQPYEPSGYPAQKRGFVYNETDIPGFVTTRDYNEQLSFIVGVDEKGLEYPIGRSGVSAHGFAPGTLRKSPASQKIVGTLAEDKLDHVLEYSPSNVETLKERLRISTQAFVPHSLRFDEELGIVIGDRLDGVAPLYTDASKWPKFSTFLKAGGTDDFPRRVSFKKLYRNEIGTLIGVPETYTVGDRYYAFPEIDAHVDPPKYAYDRAYVHPGSLFTALTSESGDHPEVDLIPKRGLIMTGLPDDGIHADGTRIYDYVKDHGVFEGWRWRKDGEGPMYFHIDAYSGQVTPDLEKAGIKPFMKHHGP